MAVTWTLLGSAETDTGNDFTVTTYTYKGTGLSSGYLIRVDIECVYNIPILLGGGDLTLVLAGGTAITHMTTAEPTSWSWTQEDQVGTNPQYTTYIGTPLDGGGAAIGSERVYRQDQRYENSGPGAGNNVSLTTMTP